MYMCEGVSVRVCICRVRLALRLELVVVDRTAFLLDPDKADRTGKGVKVIVSTRQRVNGGCTTLIALLSALLQDLVHVAPVSGPLQDCHRLM